MTRLAVAAILAAAVVLGFGRLGAAAPSGTVTPDHGLIDKQAVHVSAAGFPASDANQPIHVLECTHGATASIDCEGGTDDPTVNLQPDGSYDNKAYTVYVLPDKTLSTASIKCDSAHPCDLYIGDDYNHLQTSNHVMVPIAFGEGQGSHGGSGSSSSAPTAILIVVGVVAVGAGLLARSRIQRR